MKLNVESDLIKQQFRASVLLKLTISVRISVDSGSTENKYGIHKRTTEKRMKKKTQSSDLVRCVYSTTSGVSVHVSGSMWMSGDWMSASVLATAKKSYENPKTDTERVKEREEEKDNSNSKFSLAHSRGDIVVAVLLFLFCRHSILFVWFMHIVRLFKLFGRSDGICVWEYSCNRCMPF